MDPDGEWIDPSDEGDYEGWYQTTRKKGKKRKEGKQKGKWTKKNKNKCVQLNPAIPDPRVTEMRQYQMLNFGPFKVPVISF